MTDELTRKPCASANENLRVEPTALPTRLWRTAAGTFGWHPVNPLKGVGGRADRAMG